MATVQNETSPTCAITSRVKSASPTETPPDEMTASALRPASTMAACSASRRSGTTPMSSGSTPRRMSIARMVWRLLS
jgi:hypothetical protein